MAIRDVTDEALGNAKKSYRGNEAMEVLIENNRIVVYTGRDALLKRSNAEPDVWDVTDSILKDMNSVPGVVVAINDNKITVNGIDNSKAILAVAKIQLKCDVVVENNRLMAKKVKGL